MVEMVTLCYAYFTAIKSFKINYFRKEKWKEKGGVVRKRDRCTKCSQILLTVRFGWWTHGKFIVLFSLLLSGFKIFHNKKKFSLDLMLLSSGHAPSLHPLLCIHSQPNIFKGPTMLSSPPSYHSLRPSGFWLHPVTDTVFVRQTHAHGSDQHNLPIPTLPRGAAVSLPCWISPLSLRLHTPGLLDRPGCSSSISAAPPQPLDDGICGAPSLGSVLTSSFAMLSP